MMLMSTPSSPRAPAPDPLIVEYLAHLGAVGRRSCARSYGNHLRPFQRWLDREQRLVADTTEDDLCRYLVSVQTWRIQATGQPYAATTREGLATVLVALFAWLHLHGRILHHPAAHLVVPRAPQQRTVRAEHATVQEIVALVQTQAERAASERSGTTRWARQLRTLALIALAVASGRRAHGLLTLRLTDLDAEFGELRVAEEKGRMGRVLPLAAWAVDIAVRYRDEARPLLVLASDDPWLFTGSCGEPLSYDIFRALVVEAVAATVARHPDLTDLPGKRLTTHSLRVSFAVMLFRAGMDIRSVNELLLHQSLTTTALYTPIAFEDLRRTVFAHHPRA